MNDSEFEETMRATVVLLVTIGILASTLPICARAGAVAGAARGRALVLGGGGPVGEGWESGVIAGLQEKGIDVSRADLIIGTSAGAIVGARLASRMPPAEMIKAALVRPDRPPDQVTNQATPLPPPDLSFLIRKIQEMPTVKHPPESIRAEIGEWALKTPPVVSEAEFVASYHLRFPQKKWPSRAFECTSVAVADGSLRTWNESSRVPLDLAVASSCALPGIFAPITIDGRRYMDGGIRSATNADMAAGCKTVLVIAPTAGQTNPIATHGDLPGELKRLRESGCKVVLIAPDAASRTAFGPSLGDESRRSEAVNAGLIQGRSEAGAVAKAWSD